MEDILDKLVDLRKQATSERSHYYVASCCLEAIEEIMRLRVEVIQLKFACGYPMPAELEALIMPENPFRCGVCDAARRIPPS